MPSSGGVGYSGSGIMWCSKLRVSTGRVYLRAKFCIPPVMKACTKKKPDIQNMEGWPLSIHFWRNERRPRKSWTYPARGLSDGYDFLIHPAGTLPTVRAFATSSSSPDITMRPLSALRRLARVERTTAMRPLKRMSSCASTVFMLSSNRMGNFFITLSRSNSCGTLFKIPSAISSRISSALLPPEDPPLLDADSVRSKVSLK
mmetsp:Transcript_31441/g.79874  ORF Transcript_31441/g.79874 Transcript_31441/m.79874 type:complete len:202 (-) Transcript_31441:8147-8752(-)